MRQVNASVSVLVEKHKPECIQRLPLRGYKISSSCSLRPNGDIIIFRVTSTNCGEFSRL